MPPSEIEFSEETLCVGNPGGQAEFMADWEHWCVGLEGGWASGKALALNTVLPTPDGWTTVADVEAGNQLFNERGWPCTVISTTPIMTGHKCYRVEFSDGVTIVADAGHLWLTEDHACRKSANRSKGGQRTQRSCFPRVVTTEYIRQTLYANSRKDSNHSVQNTTPLNCVPRHLSIDPYVLGAWLGDGCSTASSIVVADNEVLAKIKNAGYRIRTQPSTKHKTASGYNISVPGTLYHDPRNGQMYSNERHFLNELRNLNLIGKHKKHIPPAYLRASISQRQELLRGLMDTDGTISKSGNCEFTTILQRLAEDVRELVLSLGMKANVTVGRAMLNGRDCGHKYRIHFTPNFAVFAIKRKLERQVATMKPQCRGNRRYIRNVVPVPSVPVKCVSVDSSSRMFLCSDAMIPTHNSFIGARKLLTLHIENAFDDNGDPTYIWSAIVAPTYSNAQDFCIPAIREACEEINLECIYKAGLHEFVLPDLGSGKNPSKIIVRTADKPERITGWQVGAAWGDEAARWKDDPYDPIRDAYLQLTARVRHDSAYFCQLMLTYTNEGDATRVYQEFRKGLSTHALYRAATKENPHAAEFLERQKELLSPELQEQYLEGGAISLRGRLLYSQFDASKHLDDTLKLTYNLPLHLSLDFNISPGMHALLGHYDRQNDTFYTVHEIHEKRLDVQNTVVAITRIVERFGGWKWAEPLQVFGDATGGSAWAGTGETCYQILAEALDAARIPFRVRIPSRNPFVQDRINSVNMALMDVRGQVHWKIHPSCERLIADLKQMRYDDSGQPDKREETLSHASEAEGYRIHYLRPIRRFDEKPTGRVSVVV